MVNQGLLAVSGIIVARAVGPHGKGVITAVTTWAQLLGLISIAGLAHATCVRVSTDRVETRAALGNALAYSITLGGLVTAGGVIVLPLLLSRLGEQADSLVVWTVATIPVAILTECLLGILLAHGRRRAYNASRLAGPLALCTTTSTLWATDRLTIAAAVAAFIVGSLVSGATAAAFMPWPVALVHLRTLRADLAFGLKVHLSSLLGLAKFRLDILLMAAYLPAAEIGLYSVANNVIYPITIIASTATILITAETARLRSDAFTTQLDQQLALVGNSAKRYSAFTLAGAAPLALALPVLVPLVFGSAFDRSVLLAWVLLPGFVALSYSDIVSAGTTGMRRPWIGNLVEGIGVLVTIGMLPFLLPRYEALGAALTSTAAYAASALVALLTLRYVAHRARGPKRIAPNEPNRIAVGSAAE